LVPKFFRSKNFSEVKNIDLPKKNVKSHFANSHFANRQFGELKRERGRRSGTNLHVAAMAGHGDDCIMGISAAGCLVRNFMCELV
jgi:hypothetical protein